MLDIEQLIDAGDLNLSNLILHNYRQLGFTEQEFLFFLQLLSASQRGNHFPDLQEIAQHMMLKQEQIFQLLSQLINKGFIKLESIVLPDGKAGDKYNLSPVYMKLEHLLKNEQQKITTAHQVSQRQNLYQLFEQEFRRPLSPLEMETLASWVEQDHYSPELIRLALKEAVLNQAYSFKYIDRILLTWERKNITTKEQVYKEQQYRKESVATKKEQSQNQWSKEELPHIPLYNWLDPDEENK